MAEVFDYVEYPTLEAYAEFYERYVHDTGLNEAMFWVPNPDTGNMTLARTGVWDHREKDLINALSSPEFKGVKTDVAPVFKTGHRLYETPEKNYRFGRSEEAIEQYRESGRNNAHFPLLGFDVVRDYWPSGEHRLWAFNWLDAHLSLRFHNLTDEQLVLLYEKTNMLHGLPYSKDDRVNLFYDLRKVDGITDREAFYRVGLTKRLTNGNDMAAGSISTAVKRAKLAGALVRKYPKVRDTDGGRARPLTTIGLVVERLGGDRALKDLSAEDWDKAFSLGVGVYAGSRSREMPSTKDLSPKDRLDTFTKVEKRVKNRIALKRKGVSGMTRIDEEALYELACWVNDRQRGGISRLRVEMSEDKRRAVAKAAHVLGVVFEGDL